MSEAKPRILICDDAPAVHESLTAYLKAEGMDVVSLYDGESALKKVSEEHFDLLVLDVMLPKMFGTDVCREIRKTSSLPIIILSARGEEFDRVLGLELGADDYIPKPFSPREVAARIRNVLKRTMPAEPEKEVTVSAGRLTLNPEAYTASLGGSPLDLTPKEIETLVYFIQNENKVLSREQLLNKVWGYSNYVDTRAVDTMIKRLRKKIDMEKSGVDIISVYGVGYKFEIHC